MAQGVVRVSLSDWLALQARIRGSKGPGYKETVLRTGLHYIAIYAGSVGTACRLRRTIEKAYGGA